MRGVEAGRGQGKEEGAPLSLDDCLALLTKVPVRCFLLNACLTKAKDVGLNLWLVATLRIVAATGGQVHAAGILTLKQSS